MKRVLLYGALVIAIGVAVYLGTARTDRGQSPEVHTVIGGATVATRQRVFSLTDSNGTSVTDRSFRGDWLIVYFGFTHCVEVCPAELFKLSKALEALGDPARQVRVAFVTVDPERDSPQVLHTYLQALGPRFTGLTGTSEQINAAEQTFRAYAEKQPAGKDGNYAMNHSSAFYVLDPNGHFSRQISAEAAIEDLAATLRSALRLPIAAEARCDGARSGSCSQLD